MSPSLLVGFECCLCVGIYGVGSRAGPQLNGCHLISSSLLFSYLLFSSLLFSSLICSALFCSAFLSSSPLFSSCLFSWNPRNPPGPPGTLPDPLDPRTPGPSGTPATPETSANPWKSLETPGNPLEPPETHRTLDHPAVVSAALTRIRKWVSADTSVERTLPSRIQEHVGVTF